MWNVKYQITPEMANSEQRTEKRQLERPLFFVNFGRLRHPANVGVCLRTAVVICHVELKTILRQIIEESGLCRTLRSYFVETTRMMIVRSGAPHSMPEHGLRLNLPDG